VATAEEVATAYQQRQRALADAAASTVARQYARLDEPALSESWAAGVGRQAEAAVTQGQLAAAQAAAPYLEQLAAAQGVPIPPPLIAASMLAGIAGDGRSLFSLLFLPILLIKSLIGRGLAYREAHRQGIAFATRIAATQVADAGRGAVTVGMTSEKRWVTYTRVVHLPACGRCIVLAGREYSYSTGFQRHDRCDCTMLPLFKDSPEHLLVRSPEELFAEMSPEQQDKAFTKAGAEAIRLGADLGQVVNARRGMSTTADGRQVTTEGTTRRGFAGRRMGATGGRKSAARPMPEQILADAGGDRDRAIDALYRFGFLSEMPKP
jgi:hypothetical protein